MADKKLGFAENFGLSGVAAVISKTAAAPIERVKLLVQNQDEMLKTGRLSEPYKGVVDCTVKTFRSEGERERWRGQKKLIYCYSKSVYCGMARLSCWLGSQDRIGWPMFVSNRVADVCIIFLVY